MIYNPIQKGAFKPYVAPGLFAFGALVPQDLVPFG
jgi:hypothetical protein